MRFNNIIQNEKDILVETYLRSNALIHNIKNVVNKYSSITGKDKKFLIENTQTEINNILNIAFDNSGIHNYFDIENLDNEMPEVYIKPDKEYMNLLKIAYQMNNKQFEQLIESAKVILNK